MTSPSIPARHTRWVQVVTVLMLCLLSAVTEAKPWRLVTWLRPFDYSSPTRILDYSPLTRSTRAWRLCVSYPHMKDAYWLSVNFGMVEQARKTKLGFNLVEAGGYPNLARQIAQIKACTGPGVDALIVGTVSFEGLTPTLVDIARRIPVIATVNDIADAGVTAKTGVSWTTMGAVVGEYLTQLHPRGSPVVKVAWFPGPKGAGWVPFVDKGFRQAAARGASEVVITKWGDTGKEEQRTLVQEALESGLSFDYIVGNALAAEAAVSLLRAGGLSDRIGILSTYLTHAVYRGIKRGRIIAAPTDSPVMQGRISIDQALRILEGKSYLKHAGPEIFMVDSANVNTLNPDASLAPPTFLPTFRVDPGR